MKRALTGNATGFATVLSQGAQRAITGGQDMISRRQLLGCGAAGLALTVTAAWRAAPTRATEAFEVVKTEAEWRAALTPEQYPCCGRAAPSGRSPAR